MNPKTFAHLRLELGLDEAGQAAAAEAMPDTELAGDCLPRHVLAMPLRWRRWCDVEDAGRATWTTAGVLMPELPPARLQAAEMAAPARSRQHQPRDWESAVLDIGYVEVQNAS